MLTREEILSLLAMKPHPEGGFYRETYRANEEIPAEALPGRYQGARHHGTAIYFMLTVDSPSWIHRVKSDEIYLFHCGDPVEILMLFPDGSGRVERLGLDLAAGMRPQIVIPRGAWQGSYIKDVAAGYALISTTVSPGFDFRDFEMGKRSELSASHPAYADLIARLSGPG